MERDFTASGVWNGGDFELELSFGPLDEADLRAGVAALWAHPTLAGCYLRQDRDTAQQPAFAPHDPALPLPNQVWYGFAALPNGARVPCRSCAGWYEGSIGFANLGVPTGSLELGYPIGAYPSVVEWLDDWRGPVSEWLRGIGEAVFAVRPFRLGQVGPEVMVDPDSPADRDDWVVPAVRGIGYLRPEKGQLVWYPPTTEWWRE
jgi:hypothetical protein